MVRLISMAMTGYYRTMQRPRVHQPLSMLKYDPIGTFSCLGDVLASEEMGPKKKRKRKKRRSRELAERGKQSGNAPRTCGDGARRETGATWARTQLTGSQCGNKSSSSRRSAERNSADRSIRFREGTGAPSRGIRMTNIKAWRSGIDREPRPRTTRERGEEEEECTTTCTTPTPTHTHPHIRREDGLGIVLYQDGE
jgi:hypothetical protein